MFITKFIVIAITLAASQALAQSNVSPPGYYIGIAPAEDRWVTLPMGAVYQGVEISYLLGQKLLDSGKFIPVLIDPPPPATPVATPAPAHALDMVSSQAALVDRQAQIPNEWTTWLQNSSAAMYAPNYSIRIQPVVEELLYSSGERSDRAVYGFSPAHLNLFNQGRAGALDNGYVASIDQAQQCQKADFFNGQLDPNGYGPFSSNFGANFDEGVTFDIFGQGVAFILKKFQVADQIRFLVDDSQAGTHQEYVFNTQAKGTDVYVWASYENYSGSIDIQTRTTMIAALQNLLPQIVDDLIGQRFAGPWEATIASISNGITLSAGLNQSVQQGLQLQSQNGNIFEVQYTNVDSATLVLVSGTSEVQVGDVVQAYYGKPLVWATPTPAPAPVVPVAPLEVASNTSSANGPRVLASEPAPVISGSPTNQVQTFTSQKAITLDQATRASQQVAAVAACVDKKPGMIEQALDSLFIPYGLYRYLEVFDQAAKPPTTPAPPIIAGDGPASNVAGLRIAIIDSGIDVKDSKIKAHLAFSSQNVYEGFDFISWDNRPSDDNGHGTAAAKLLLSLVKKPIVLLSAKVIGSQGETSSSAIYDGFTFAVNSQVDAIVVPWSSMASSLEAYTLGAQLAAAANIPVFVAPGTVPAQENIYVGSSGTKSFKTSGLDATVKLAPEGVAAIQALANWINSKK
jgi:hypothetical protein